MTGVQTCALPIYGSLESLTGGQEIQGNVLSGVLPDESRCRYIQLFIGKYADLFTRKGATLNSLWGVLKG